MSPWVRNRNTSALKNFIHLNFVRRILPWCSFVAGLFVPLSFENALIVVRKSVLVSSAPDHLLDLKWNFATYRISISRGKSISGTFRYPFPFLLYPYLPLIQNQGIVRSNNFLRPISRVLILSRGLVPTVYNLFSLNIEFFYFSEVPKKLGLFLLYRPLQMAPNVQQ